MNAQVLMEEPDIEGGHSGICVLRNLSSDPAKIVGVEKSCRCVVLQSILGLEIPPHGSLQFPIQIEHKVDGPYEQRLMIHLSHPSQGAVLANIVGHTSIGE